MDSNNDNLVDVSTTKIKRTTLWNNPKIHMAFVELCIIELRNGNIPTTYLNKTGYANVLQNMKEITGITFCQKQFKNHWESMKKEWKLYDRLMRHESGIGWDPIKYTIDATDEWWDEKIKADKDLAKFRGADLEMYKTYYEPLFRDSVAVGDRTKAPCEYQNDIDADANDAIDVEVEGSGDSDDNPFRDDIEPLFPEKIATEKEVVNPESSSCKRKKSKNATCNHHSSLRNVIERTFVVWKARWGILKDMHVNYTYETQVNIVLASMAIHNYIRKSSTFDKGFDKAQKESYNPTTENDTQESSSYEETQEDTSMRRRTDDLYMSAVRDMIAGDIIQSRSQSRNV